MQKSVNIVSQLLRNVGQGSRRPKFRSVPSRLASNIAAVVNNHPDVRESVLLGFSRDSKFIGKIGSVAQPPQLIPAVGYTFTSDWQYFIQFWCLCGQDKVFLIAEAPLFAAASQTPHVNDEDAPASFSGATMKLLIWESPDSEVFDILFASYRTRLPAIFIFASIP